MATNWSSHTEGQWRTILTEIIGPEYLDGKHHPCPRGEGVDRFRYSDMNGRGNYFCACSDGKKDGFDLIQCLLGCDFGTAADIVAGIVGEPDNEVTEAPRRKGRDWSRLKTTATKRSRYLESRFLEVPPGLRWISKFSYYDGDGKRVGDFPAMLAPIERDGKLLTYHVTYLDGGSKAPVEKPRKIMPSDYRLSGAACPLYPWEPVLGIAEGVETAIAAKMIHAGPVWAALNTELLRTWEPPKGTQRVFIFADHDRNYAGQSAATALAHRLVRKGIEAEVLMPAEPGDWNSVLIRAEGNIGLAREREASAIARREAGTSL